MMSALSRDVHCFWFCSATQNQPLLKESIKIDAKIRELRPTHVTSEHRTPRAVPLSKVSLPFRASVQAFSKKCGRFRYLRCFVIGLACLIRWCLRYQVMFIVFRSVRRHKISDYSKKALKLMRKYAKNKRIRRMAERTNHVPRPSRSFSINYGHCSKKDTSRRVLRVEHTNAGIGERGSKHVTHRFYIIHVH